MDRLTVMRCGCGWQVFDALILYRPETLVRPWAEGRRLGLLRLQDVQQRRCECTSSSIIHAYALPLFARSPNSALHCES